METTKREHARSSLRAEVGGRGRLALAAVRERVRGVLGATTAQAGPEATPTPTTVQPRHYLRFAVFLAPAAQLAVILWVILTRTPLLPFWDEWANTPLVQHADSGTLTWNDFWALHNDSHRIVLPRVILLTLVQLTHWNVRAEMLADVALALLTAGLLFACVRRTLRSDRLTLALVVPLSLLCFSLSFYADWFAPFQMAFFLSVLGVILSMWAFQRDRTGWRGFALALAGALIASLSSFGGLAVWVVFLPSVMRSGYRRTALWAASALAIGVPYMIGYPLGGGQSLVGQAPGVPVAAVALVPASSGAVGLLLHILRVAPSFALAYLGAPLGYPSYRASQLFGLLGIILLLGGLYLRWRRHHRIADLLIWIELALFALATDAITTLGRVNAGPLVALSSRFHIFPALYWVTVVVVTALVVRDDARTLPAGGLAHLLAPPRRRATVFLASGALALLLICAGAVHANVVGAQEGVAWQDDLRASQWCVVNGAGPADCMGKWWPVENTPLGLQYAAYLRQHHYAIFYGR